MNSLAQFPFRAVRRALAVVSLFAAASVFAGPPVICHPYEIGSAKSLPAGTAWHGVSQSYDRRNLVDDTLALLTPDMPVLVRMETLRRAAIYSTNFLKSWDRGAYTAEDRQLGLGLLARLEQRAKEAKGPRRAVALFDVGFFAETLRQTNMDPGMDGYPLLLQAAELRADDPALAFALAIAGAAPERADQRTHLARARRGAQPGSLLAANLESHFTRS